VSPAEGGAARLVDVHAHHLPERLGAEFTRLSGIRYPLRHPEDQSRRLADLDEAGVDEQILGLGAVQPYWPDAAASTEGARFANDLYAQSCADEPRLSAFGALPLPHVDEAAAEAVRCLDELGFAGIGLGCSANGIALDDARFDDVWSALDERSAVVYLHPGVQNDLAVGVREYPMLLGPVFGSPAEEAVAITRLALKGTVRRFPRIRWIAGAMGGALLLAHDQLFHSLAFAAKTGADQDLDGIRGDLQTFWYDTSSLDGLLALAAREHGYLDRLLFGSDAPWGSAVAASLALREHLPEEAEAVRARSAAVLAG
jgi:aminocarboxymuconate-semialdehyde decarboxylase